MPRNPNAERDNPCLREQELSYKCLNQNNFDREKCEVYFANYKNCKDFWVSRLSFYDLRLTLENILTKGKVRADRRAKGIIPYLPPVEEREAIKNEYMKDKPK